MELDLEQAVKLDRSNAAAFGQSVETELEKMRGGLLELKKRGASQEEYAKHVEGIASLTQQVDGFRKELLDMKRKEEIPGPDVSDKPIANLSHIQLSQFHAEELQDKEMGDTLSRTAKQRGQFDLICRPAADLGIDDDKTIKQLARMRALHDTIVARAIAKSVEPQNFIDSGGWRQFPEAPEYSKLTKRFSGALGAGSGATATEGPEWVPALVLSGPVVPIVELEIPFQASCDSWQMNYISQRRRIKKSHGNFYSVRENVADAGTSTNATLVPGSFATERVTFTAVKFGSAMVETPEWDQDVVDVNAGVEINSDLAYNLDDCLEDCLINGQTTLIDAAYPSTPASTDSNQLMVDGIRRFFVQTGVTAQDFGSGVTGDGLAAIWGGQGAWAFPASECRWLTGAAGLARLMVARAADGSPLFLTYLALGRPGAIVTGVLGEVYGRGVIVSKRVPETLNASGIIPSGGSTKTAIYHVRTSRVSAGKRMGTVVARSLDARFFQDQVAYKATRRFDVKPLVPGGTVTSAYKIVGAGYNVGTF